jgi:hypothetical protein
MQYNNSSVRRQDRLLDIETAKMLLKNAEYGILSMQSLNDGPYGIPVNFVWDNKKSIYIHCAPQGRKLMFLNQCNKVSFCIVGNTNVISNQFTTEYQSIIIEGTANIHLDKNKRTKALELIVEKYSPNDKEVGMKYIQKSFHRTQIIRIDIEKWSGKSKSIIGK